MSIKNGEWLDSAPTGTLAVIDKETWIKCEENYGTYGIWCNIETGKLSYYPKAIYTPGILVRAYGYPDLVKPWL